MLAGKQLTEKVDWQCSGFIFLASIWVSSNTNDSMEVLKVWYCFIGY